MASVDTLQAQKMDIHDLQALIQNKSLAKGSSPSKLYIQEDNSNTEELDDTRTH